ncbi:MAG: riboflavin biosynthesis protein RibF [Clostridia bacterium]|nr:riboflavin biosynthesis protein RibF [Clostridia bacterium]MBR3715381.1 riboflavin biosynthesis protein RibF [Clostridia bacterium]
MIIKNICDAELSGLSRHIVALGNFDGVHYAHTELIRKAKEIAFSLCETAGEKVLTAVFTFSDLKKPYITTTDEKLAIFEKLGVDCVFLCPFEYVRNMSPEDFVHDILVKKLGCVHTVCGYNYRFGKNATGDQFLLGELAKKYSFGCTVIGEIPGVSSTRIRELVSSGRIAEANEIIGRPFTVSGRIIHGRGVGHTFGCPTLNIEIPEGKLLPLNGVYFSLCRIGKDLYPSITNVGVCPTFGTDKITCENHLIDVSCELYGEFAEVFFLAFRRSEKRFSSPEELYKTVNEDISAARDFHIYHYQ